MVFGIEPRVSEGKDDELVVGLDGFGLVALAVGELAGEIGGFGEQPRAAFLDGVIDAMLVHLVLKQESGHC
jgi:hypothetical protein